MLSPAGAAAREPRRPLATTEHRCAHQDRSHGPRHHAVDILNNRKYPLKLGWVGVVNRSQQDIEGRKTLADAKEAEKSYFHSGDSPYRCVLHFIRNIQEEDL